MNKLLLLVLFISPGLCLTAQVDNYLTRSNNSTEYEFMAMANKMQTKKNISYEVSAQEYKKIRGTPYWHKDICLAKVVQNDDVIIKNVSLRLDQYIGEVIAQAAGQNLLLLETRMYKELFVADGDNLDYFRKVHPNNPHKFYQILFENNKAIVFKDIVVKMTKTESTNAVMGVNKPEFHRKKLYFILLDGQIREIQFKKKKFFQSFTKKEGKLMATFAKKNKLKLKDEMDFVLLLNHLYDQTPDMKK